MNCINQLKSVFSEYLTTLLPHGSCLPTHDLTLNVEAQRQQFGDLSSNAALILAKVLHKQPRIVAQEILEGFSHPLIDRMELAGPGFINIFLKPEAFQQLLLQMRTEKDRFFQEEAAPSYTYSLEFVSANPTGPLHIGHGRNGIIGDVLGRVLRFLGCPVTTEFYINDAGGQMLKLGQSLKARCKELLGLPASIPEEGYHGTYLIDLAKKCMQEHSDKIIEQDDAFFTTYAKEALLEEQKKSLNSYRINFDVWFSELQLHTSNAIERTLERVQKAGYLYEKDGALWFAASQLGDEKDRVVRRSSGEYTYVAADMAYLENKIARGFTKIIIIVGQDHHGYVARLKALLTSLGQNPDILDVILYQVVTLKNEGACIKLSKRAGRIISLDDIIETVGVDVARFFYLNRKADAHLDFDIGLACKRTEENPVFYLQYAYVRTGSILEKAAAHTAYNDRGEADIAALTPAEHLLIKKMVLLGPLLQHIATTYQTHMLSYYVLELAHIFHSYYGAHRIIDHEQVQQTRARLLVVEQLQHTLSLCLSLLGVSCPQQM